MTTIKLENCFGFQTITVNRVPCNHSFLTISTQLMMNMNTTSFGLIFQPVDRFFPKYIKRFLKSRLWRLDFFRRQTTLVPPPPPTPLYKSLSPQTTRFAKSLVTFPARIMSCHFVEVCYQESVVFINAYCHRGNTYFPKMRQQILQRK